MDERKDGELGILARRRIEAAIVAPIYDEMRKAVGEDKARGVKHDLRRLPPSGHAAGVWQLFFFDPSGARVDIDFAATETDEPQG